MSTKAAAVPRPKSPTPEVRIVFKHHALVRAHALAQRPPAARHDRQRARDLLGGARLRARAEPGNGKHRLPGRPRRLDRAARPGSARLRPARRRGSTITSASARSSSPSRCASTGSSPTSSWPTDCCIWSACSPGAATRRSCRGARDVREALAMQWYYVGLVPAKLLRRPWPHPAVTTKYNALQRAAYFAMPVCGALSVLSGWAMHKPVQLPWLERLFVNYNGARVVHFWMMCAFAAFVVPHVLLVIADGWDTFPLDGHGLVGPGEGEPPWRVSAASSRSPSRRPPTFARRRALGAHAARLSSLRRRRGRRGAGILVAHARRRGDAVLPAGRHRHPRHCRRAPGPDQGPAREVLEPRADVRRRRRRGAVLARPRGAHLHESRHHAAAQQLRRRRRRTPGTSPAGR